MYASLECEKDEYISHFCNSGVQTKHPAPDGHPVTLDFALAGPLIGDFASEGHDTREVVLYFYTFYISGFQATTSVRHYLVTAVI